MGPSVCWQRAATYASDQEAPRRARQFTSTALTQLLGHNAEVIDDAELVVSELVTNAVKAHASGVTLSLDVHRSRVRIAVQDDGVGTPVAARPSEYDDHGRGLLIVASVSSDWGVQPLARGKQVWADLAVADPFAADDFTCDFPSAGPVA